MSAFGVVLFPTTSSVMRAEKVLARQGLAVKLVPTPRELSSDCGIALRFAWLDRALVEETLRHAGLDVEGIHPLS